MSHADHGQRQSQADDRQHSQAKSDPSTGSYLDHSFAAPRPALLPLESLLTNAVSLISVFMITNSSNAGNSKMEYCRPFQDNE